MQRVTGKATYTGDVSCPACCTRACCAARIRTRASVKIDASKALALPGRQGGAHARELQRRLGRRRRRGRRQYVEEVKKITKQRRYAFNNPVRFVGEPVAAVAAIDRHTAEEALRLIQVDYEVLPFVLDPEEALKPGAVQIWPEGNLSLDVSATSRADGREARQCRGRLPQRRDHVFEDRYSTTFVHNAQMEPRVGVAAWEGDKLTVYTPTGGIANCRTDMARDLGIPQEKSASSASTWAATSATRIRTRMPT